MQVHPAQISPGESYDAFYFIRNHTDATTYYVQAKVYDVRTGELLDTYTLTQSATNARLFITTKVAPPDPTGYGRNIVVIATVYTDSGFTTKSDNYEEQEQYFLIKNAVSFGGGGGAIIDYGTIHEILKEEVKKGLENLPKPEKLEVPDAPDMSFVQALFGSLGVITRELGKVPKEGADLSGLAKDIDALKAALDARPTFEATDLSQVTDLSQSILSQLEALSNDVKVGNAQLVQSLESALKTFASNFETSIAAKIEDTIQSQELTLPLTMKVGGKGKQQDAPDPLAAIKHLTG